MLLRYKELAHLVSAVRGAERRSAAYYNLVLPLPLCSCVKRFGSRHIGVCVSSAAQTVPEDRGGAPQSSGSRVSIPGLTQPCLVQCAVPHRAIHSALQDVPAYLLCAGLCARGWRHSGTHTHEVLLSRSKHSRTFWHDAYVLYHVVQSGSH